MEWQASPHIPLEVVKKIAYITAVFWLLFDLVL